MGLQHVTDKSVSWILICQVCFHYVRTFTLIVKKCIPYIILIEQFKCSCYYLHQTKHIAMNMSSPSLLIALAAPLERGSTLLPHRLVRARGANGPHPRSARAAAPVGSALSAL